ncbi:hypothetical protein C8039_18685 [Halogeometricum sp. wsp3]|nr:hypothetical protein C8039_18685 [Halogeometricum sp. wsp3]
MSIAALHTKVATLGQVKPSLDSQRWHRQRQCLQFRQQKAVAVLGSGGLFVIVAVATTIGIIEPL